MAKPASVIVETLSGLDPINPETVTLLVLYDGKECRITLPVPKPRYEREPGVEAYRLELHSMIESVLEWAKSAGDVTWPRPD